jgi:hypothetical protein
MQALPDAGSRVAITDERRAAPMTNAGLPELSRRVPIKGSVRKGVVLSHLDVLQRARTMTMCKAGGSILEGGEAVIDVTHEGP